MQHTITVLVENHSGVLSRVSGLFSSRGFNIKSLTVGETEEPTISRMTIVVGGDDKIIEQVKKQLNKLIDVIKVMDISSREYIERELMFVKINAKKNERQEIFEIANVFRGNIVDIGTKTCTIEVTGPTKKINGLLDLLKPYGIIEIARTGAVAMLRDEKK